MKNLKFKKTEYNKITTPTAEAKPITGSVTILLTTGTKKIVTS